MIDFLPTSLTPGYEEDFYIAPQSTPTSTPTSPVLGNPELDHILDNIDLVTSATVIDEISPTTAPVLPTQTTGAFVVQDEGQAEEEDFLAGKIYKPVNGDIDRLWAAATILALVIITMVKIVRAFLTVYKLPGLTIYVICSHSDWLLTISLCKRNPPTSAADLEN